jgi:hypothetical protein
MEKEVYMDQAEIEKMVMIQAEERDRKKKLDSDMKALNLVYKKKGHSELNIQ